MARIGGTCYFKIDGQQLSLTGGIEVPMNRTVNDDIIGLDGSVDRKETHRAPYVKGTFKVPKNFPVSKITSSDEMTITAELANGQVYVLSSAWLHGEANHNAEEGTVDLEFHGEEGDYPARLKVCSVSLRDFRKKSPALLWALPGRVLQ